MADMESICARLCLLTRAAWRDDLPAPLMRANVRRMIRMGALSGLTLREVPGVKDIYYERARALLSRSAQVYDELARCHTQGYNVILPEDDDWPVNLCALGMHMPQFLFLRGSRELISRRAVAVAGSRNIDEHTNVLAQDIGRELATRGYTLVCGGARGVDTAVQKACLQSGGSLILVPAYPAEQLLAQEYLAQALDAGHLLIACDTWPHESFSAQKALTRNHTIYALGNVAIAVASRKRVGGTWRGSVDCIRGKYTPLFAVDQPGKDFDGNRALFALGAKPLDMMAPIGPQLFGKEV